MWQNRTPQQILMRPLTRITGPPKSRKSLGVMRLRRIAKLVAPAAIFLVLTNCADSPEAKTDTAPPLEKPEVSRVSAGDTKCLAEAIYFEARGTSASGQAAVGHVVLNRAESSEFPNSVCGVIADKCQFSYRCDGRSDVLSSPADRDKAVRIAKSVLSGAPDPTNGALFFHSARIPPGWFSNLERVGTFGGNVFYR